MRTIFSIISIPINAALEEKVSVGIVMSDRINYKIAFSKKKLSAVKSIISPERASFLKAYLRSLEKQMSVIVDELFSKNIEQSEKWITFPYLSYLSSYSNNLVTFSRPKSLIAEMDQNIFVNVFEKYIGKYKEESFHESEDISIASVVKSTLYPTITNNVNLDVTVTSEDLDNLIMPVNVNIFGKNGVPVAGQAIDFSKNQRHLENDLSRYVTLTKALDVDQKKNGKYFVIGQEPENKKNHQLWSHVHDSDFLTFVPVDEMEVIRNYIVENNVQPYFS